MNIHGDNMIFRLGQSSPLSILAQAYILSIVFIVGRCVHWRHHHHTQTLGSFMQPKMCAPTQLTIQAANGFGALVYFCAYYGNVGPI